MGVGRETGDPRTCVAGNPPRNDALRAESVVGTLLAPFELQAARDSAPTIASRLRRFIRILSEEVTGVTGRETAIRADEAAIPFRFS